MPVLGSGHPLADVFLLKYAPQPAEIHEGVAFFGRSGNALLKSLQRLGVDPMADLRHELPQVRGPSDEARRAPWLARELHIVQPKLLVVMGERRARFLERRRASRSPTPLELGAWASCSASRRRSRRSSRPTSTRRSTSQAAKTAFWNAFKALGPWWAELPPY